MTMRGESLSKLRLPLVMVGGLIVAAVVFWEVRSGIRDQRPNSERELDVPRAGLRQQESWEPPAKWLPEVESVPANALKFYLTFASAMTEGDIFTHLKLERRTDAGWQPVEGAFRETELWSPDSKRLTVWLHPGRQKTGVNLNEDEGPVLEEGGHYQLVLSGDATTQEGRHLNQDTVMSFTATEPDHNKLSPRQWTLQTATAKSVRLLFHKPLDWAMLASAFQVDGKVAEVRIDEDAQAVTVLAPAPWTSDRHVLGINPNLEDMAGNNLIRPFEVDVTAPSEAPAPGPFQMEFEVSP